MEIDRAHVTQIGGADLIHHCGLDLPNTSPRLWVCPTCGSSKIRQAQHHDWDIFCLVCDYEGKPELQSAFMARQLREAN